MIWNVEHRISKNNQEYVAIMIEIVAPIIQTIYKIGPQKTVSFNLRIICKNIVIGCFYLNCWYKVFKFVTNVFEVVGYK